MKHIEKNPDKQVIDKIATFKILQKTIGKEPVYEDFSNEDGRKELHEALLKEQGYICAYCMQRIDNSGKIEHWKGQSEHGENSLDYDNMFAVCRGKMGEKTVDFHCDTKRSEYQSIGQGDLTLNPTNANHIHSLKYLRNGTIYHQNIEISTEEDKSKLSLIDIDLQYHLNLNHLYLKDNRAKVYAAVSQVLDVLRKTGKSQGFIQTQKQKLLRQWQEKTENRFKPYCGIVVYFLQR